MSAAVAESYALCRRVARRTARNFYYSFLVLPADKRRAMCALYAFLRHTDDLGDGHEPVERRREALARWRASLDRALTGRFDSPLLPALADAAARYAIPPEYLHAAITGVESDLSDRSFDTFDDLADYCYHVASVVGLACIHVWGFSDERAIEPARKCGVAMQLTNILRDLKEDAARGRVYLPQEDLDRFGYTRDDLASGVRDSRFRALMQFEIERTERLYDESAALAQWLDADGRAALGAMTDIYRALLVEIKRRNGDVFTRRIRVSRLKKLRIATRWLLRSGAWTRIGRRPNSAYVVAPAGEASRT